MIKKKKEKKEGKGKGKSRACEPGASLHVLSPGMHTNHHAGRDHSTLPFDGYCTGGKKRERKERINDGGQIELHTFGARCSRITPDAGKKQKEKRKGGRGEKEGRGGPTLYGAELEFRALPHKKQDKRKRGEGGRVGEDATIRANPSTVFC